MIEYFLHLLIFILIYTILSTGFNLAVGYTGLLNLGHIAFFSLGAYSAAILTVKGVSFVPTLFFAAVFTSLFGFLLVKATAKLTGDYLALATLGFSFVINSTLLNWTSLTRGARGISGIMRPSIVGFSFSTNFSYMLLCLVIAAMLYLFAELLARSPFGLLLQATRDNELQLRALGKNTSVLKIKSMMVSASYAGIAGALFAQYLSYIDPSVFSLTEMIFVFSVIVFGGLASLKGTVIATVILFLVPEILRFLALPSTVLGPLRQIFYALILLILLLIKPRGLYGRIDLQ